MVADDGMEVSYLHDGGELLEILRKRRSQSIDVRSVTNAKGKIVSSISMWSIVNQLGKHDFSFWCDFFRW